MIWVGPVSQGPCEEAWQRKGREIMVDAEGIGGRWLSEKFEGAALLALGMEGKAMSHGLQVASWS